MWNELSRQFIEVASKALYVRLRAEKIYEGFALAGYLLCAVERDNKSTIDEIVKAATSAEIGRVMTAIVDIARRGSSAGAKAAAYEKFDQAEFFRLLALEMICEPVSWFTEHERFTLPDCSPDAACAQCGLSIRNIFHSWSAEECAMDGCITPQDHHNFIPPSRPFVVPRIEFS